MKKLAAEDELEKTQGALTVAKERLDAVTKRIPELDTELEELIFVNETKGYKGQAINRTQTEHNKLKAEREILEKTIAALRKKLPELEKAAKDRDGRNGDNSSL